MPIIPDHLELLKVRLLLAIFPLLAPTVIQSFGALTGLSRDTLNLFYGPYSCFMISNLYSSFKDQILLLYADARKNNRMSHDYRVALVLIILPVLLAISYYYGKPYFYISELKTSGIAVFGADYEYLKMLPYVYMSSVMVITRILIPCLIIIYIFRDALSDYGWKTRGISKHITLYLVLYILCLPFIYLASLQSGFLASYPFYKNAALGGWHFWGYETIYMLQLFCVEAFFRGFLLFALYRKFGYYAVLILLTPYCLIHFGKPFPEVMAAIFSGALLGVLALRTGSFYLGAALHMAVAFTMDIASLYQKGLL